MINILAWSGGTVAYAGVSTDTKPPATNGSSFLESDTGKMFLMEVGSWVEKTNASYAQPLVSGENIKTINGSSILGSGDLIVAGAAAWGSVLGVLSAQTDLQSALDAKQASGNYATAPFVTTLASNVATGANVTPVSLTGLVFNYSINSIYRIWFMGRVSPAAATTGCGFQFDLSSAVTDINVSFYHQLANAGTLSGGSSIADDASAGVSSGMPANGGVYPVVGDGILRTGVNTGTAQLRFRSETTAVVTCMAGMTMVVEKIA